MGSGGICRAALSTSTSRRSATLSPILIGVPRAMPTMAPIAKIAVKAFIVMASWKKVSWTSLFEEWLEYVPKALNVELGLENGTYERR